MVIGFLNMTIFEFNIFTINIICVKVTKVLWYSSFVNKFIQHMLLDDKKLTPMEKYMNKYILCTRGDCYIESVELVT
jgi:hypothetical protein